MSEPNASSIWVPPAAEVGDQVYWYPNPLECKNPALGWIADGTGDPNRPPENRPRTVRIVIVTPNGTLDDRLSVRHKDDPGLIDNEAWRKWGCWEFSRQSQDLRRIQQLLPGVTALLAKSAAKKE